jgi:hypothetical protein
MLVKDIFREVEAFDFKSEAFIKVMILFEDVFNGNEDFLKRFEAFLNYFQKNVGFFH